MSARARFGRSRWLVAALVTAGMLAGTGAAFAPPAAAADDYALAAAFVADINQARAAAGLAPYAVAGDLASIAAGHSAAMAASQTLYHNPDLTTAVADWQSVGENVGVGPTVSAINTAFLNSPPHRANILDPHFTQVGVGVVVDSRGAVWVTEDFRQPMAVSPPPPPAPAPVRAVSVPVAHPAAPSTGAPVAQRPTAAAGAAPATPSRPAARPGPARAAALARKRLAGRLAWVQAHLPESAPDPVSQALSYVAALSALTGS